ncbi:hypothetical protein [Desulfogranum marinum]|uniref:hypothetical protein n=1 Tax=Desulfogranum marinum TaxID=453220 RepID=UPI001966BDB2|nr:hypothetical protein [Desulfogranum marinum]MBM9513154.1 hypothetical protein [Desulfogranum marinum]
MKIVTFRYQRFASVLQKTKKEKDMQVTPDSERAYYIKKIALIGNRPEVILGSWQ